MRRNLCQLNLLVLLGITLAVGSLPSSDEPAPKKTKVRLAVLVVFDQLRGDYLPRWEKLFVEDGFRRMLKDGAWFSNCHYPYAATLTAPGHASLATGTSPYKHGIIANDWYDRQEANMVSAVLSKRHRPVPTPPVPERNQFAAAPLRRRQPSIGDALLAANKGKGRVVSLSLKDRAAILLAALRAICYWFSTETGGFVTSTYYSDTLHRWVSEVNRSRRAASWFNRDWTRLVPELDYARHAGPDDNDAEGTGYDQGRTFPHPTHGGPGRFYYQAMLNTPFGNQLLLELAKKAIDAEKLGQRAVPDLLCLSFSSNDLIGHTWGPDSQEVLDVTLRSDRIIKELLDHLDARVGRGNYVLAISADHGICPIPEQARAQGKKAGRVSPELLTSGAEGFLNARFSPRKQPLPWIEAAADGNIYLNRRLLRLLRLESAEVEQALAGWLAKQPGVQAAFTRRQLSAKPPVADAPGSPGLAEMVRLSFDPERSGDVLVVLQPYHLLSPPVSPRLASYRTTHGSPHPYDTHVPLLVYGGDIRAGAHNERVTPQAIVPILCCALGIEPPAGCEAPLPAGIFP